MATLDAARRTARAKLYDVDAPQLRVLTCGSVDDGKSTLLGRLLFDTESVLEDQISALEQDSRRWGTQGGARDYALLLDGLSAEREQGITIDVAYRYFSTRRRSFIVADTPGHEQYTRNMATGASQADLAIILVDARKGVLPQTRRHAFIVATLGVRHAVLAINKMDLVGFSRERWQEIADAFAAAARPLGFRSIVPVPICARDGDNVAVRSARMPWYDGPVLLDHLEAIDVAPPSAAPKPFRLPVQIVLRPDAEFRGYAGTVGGGTVRAGDAAVALPSGKRTMVARIVTADGDKAEASAGEAVTLTLADEIDVARGDVLAAADDPPQASDRLRATLLWMAEDSLLTGRDYVLQIGPASANARVARIRHAVDIESYAPRPATWLGLNEIGLADLELDRPLAAAPYRQDEALGALVLVDRLSHETVAMGVIEAVGVDAERGGRWARRLQPRRFAPALLGGAAMFLLALLLSRDVALAGTLGCANLLISLAFGGLVNASK